MMFYTYRQNNSGGGFVVNDDVTLVVIFQADNSADANYRAQGVGIYFDGVDKGIDCGCCGDRWAEAWSDDGDPEPMIYGEPIATWNSWFNQPGQPYAHVYYKDGSKKSFKEESE